MSTRDRVTQAAEVLSQVQFHLQGGFVRHGVQVGIEFGSRVEFWWYWRWRLQAAVSGRFFWRQLEPDNHAQSP